MKKREWILAAVAVVLGGLVYWFEYGPGTRIDVQMEKRDTVRGDGFEVAVPKGYQLVTEQGMPIPKGAIALAKKTDAVVTTGHTSTVVIVPVPKSPMELDPQNVQQCEQVGKQMATAQKIEFRRAAIIDTPFGKTCEIQTEIHTSMGGSVTGRMVVAHKGGRQWAITCRMETGDEVAENGCQHVIERIVMK
jgi:hypothetical protein